MAYSRVQKIQSFNSLIAVPYVTCEFGGQQFGLRDKYKTSTKTRDINYITSLEISKKASGQVNTYTLGLTYVVEPGADPNYIDYIIANATDRNILFSYGDLSQPEYSYVQEKAMMTTIVPNVSVSQNAITYTINATSSVALSYSIKRSFPARRAKPSDVIFDILYNDTENGLLELFSGMRDRAWVEEQGLIARNDQVIQIDAETDKTPLEYLRILMSKMESSDGSFYAMIIHDEPDNINGPYFQIINSNLYQGQGTHYSLEIDVGYPSDTPVISFVPSVNTSIALINQFQEKFDGNRIMNINDEGEFSRGSTPSLTIRNGTTNESLVKWWRNMSNYPINAVLTTRGLIKPSILCDYIHINVLFFGQPYNYSGMYMVTAQKDKIDESSGYQTELTLVRVEGVEQ